MLSLAGFLFTGVAGVFFVIGFLICYNLEKIYILGVPGLMKKYVEKRSRVRIDYKAAITICPNGYSSIQGQSANVSMDGVFIRAENEVPSGVVCGVNMVLQGPNSKLSIDIDGVVARTEEGALAVQFRNNLEWWAIFTIYAQYSGNSPTGNSLCFPETEV